jgi:hypothetical protein
MSLFLIYFEMGKPVPPSPVPAALWPVPITITLRGRSGPPREGTVLTYGGSSEAFVAFERGYKQEGKMLRKSLFEFVRQRLEVRAHPHLVFNWLGGRIETISVDINTVVRVPASKLEQRLRTLEGFPIVDSSEVMEVVPDGPGDDEDQRPASSILVGISAENATSEPEPMKWEGHIDMLVGETLVRVGSSPGSVFLLRGLVELGGMLCRLRGNARTAAHTFVKDTSPLRFARQPTGGALAVTVVYRDVETAPVRVNALDEACRDAVLQFFKSLSPEQRLALRSEDATRLLAAITSVWPELKQVT